MKPNDYIPNELPSPNNKKSTEPTSPYHKGEVNDVGLKFNELREKYGYGIKGIDKSTHEGYIECGICKKVVKGILMYNNHLRYEHDTSRPMIKAGKKRINRMILRSELVEAMERNYGIKARVLKELGISSHTLKRYIERHLSADEIEKYKVLNNNGYGWGKFFIHNKRAAKIDRATNKYKDILSGKIMPTIQCISTTQLMIKKFISRGLLPGMCHLCGFSERRVSDDTVPLIADFIDGDRLNWKEENIRILCYNCYYLNVREIWGRAMLNLETGYGKAIWESKKDLSVKNRKNYFEQLHRDKRENNMKVMGASKNAKTVYEDKYIKRTQVPKAQREAAISVDNTTMTLDQFKEVHYGKVGTEERDALEEGYKIFKEGVVNNTYTTQSMGYSSPLTDSIGNVGTVTTNTLLIYGSLPTDSDGNVSGSNLPDNGWYS